MPYQNRVTPWGTLIATTARGTLMGNRGCLHDSQGHIRRSFQGQRWIICVLAFKDRHRIVMTAGQYTHLFFLDEVTAMAAGHRPCAECQRARFDEYRIYWRTASGDGGALPRATTIDQQLHGERLSNNGGNSHPTTLRNLPDGTFVAMAGEAYLWWERRLLHWTPAGYDHAIVPPDASPEVLTPRSTIGVLGAGFRPGVHVSAKRLTNR